MSVKIRLQRHGKKGKPFFHIVVADARASRDGKFIEKIGTYNPVTNPAVIDLNVDAAVKWLNNGAQPTDTARAILSYKGVLYKKHLLGGVAKGAFDQATADEKFATWLAGKEQQVLGKKDGLSKAKDEAKKAALEAEAKVNQGRLDAAAKIEADAKAEADAKLAEEKAAEDAKIAEAKAAEEAANAPAEEAVEEKTAVETVAETLGGAAAVVAGAIDTVKETVANVTEKLAGSDEATEEGADEAKA
ncbi:30S ribosomal protein S16 [Kaistella solincola]|uniref:Small ribosomal subunit protein bS16 n=1 Tax=Kaistella solincola TaxID=510955 RepID=A0ABR4ZPL6_9FLAO|nr:30S ribosomal protein S16 [Kaistella solincola]